jgi:hypothetical protein
MKLNPLFWMSVERGDIYTKVLVIPQLYEVLAIAEINSLTVHENLFNLKFFFREVCTICIATVILPSRSNDSFL